jgi:hypothetical protein
MKSSSGVSRVLIFAALGAASALVLSACSSHESGELVVVVTTDLAVRTDIDWLGWTIVRPSHANAVEHGSLSLSSFDSLPGTLAIISGEDGPEPVQLAVEGRIGGENGTLRVHREARLTMPVGQKMLQMPLN